MDLPGVKFTDKLFKKEYLRSPEKSGFVLIIGQYFHH